MQNFLLLQVLMSRNNILFSVKDRNDVQLENNISFFTFWQIYKPINITPMFFLVMNFYSKRHISFE